MDLHTTCEEGIALMYSVVCVCVCVHACVCVCVCTCVCVCVCGVISTLFLLARPLLHPHVHSITIIQCLSFCLSLSDGAIL